MKHVCHPLHEKHESCLVELYKLYLGLVLSISIEVTAFYFKPNAKRFVYDKQPVGINTLNAILPSMYEEASFKWKTSNSLRVTCASTLLNGSVEEKLIRERTGHWSNALFKNEKISEVCSGFRCTLAPQCSSTSDVSETVEVGRSESTFECMSSAVFHNCNINITVNRLSKNE